MIKLPCVGEPEEPVEVERRGYNEAHPEGQTPRRCWNQAHFLTGKFKS